MNDIKQRLRNSRNWLHLIEDMEASVDRLTDKAQKSQALYELGQVCENLFLRKDKAMVSYQKAFKLFPQDALPLARARQIYREMGNLSMVAKLMEFQTKLVNEPGARAELLADLATITVDLRNPDRAQGFLKEALTHDPNNVRARDLLAVLNRDRATWQEQVATLLRTAEDLGVDSPMEAARLMLQAVRIHQLEEEGGPYHEELLRKVLDFAPGHSEANYLIEGLLQQEQRWEELLALHNHRLDLATDEDRQALLLHFATLWSIRFNSLPIAATFYEQALRAMYMGQAEAFEGHVAAFRLVCEVAQGDPERLHELAMLAATALSGEGAALSTEDALLLAIEAGELAWRGLEDIDLAAGFFAKVRSVDEKNALLVEFGERHPEALAQATASGSSRAEVVDMTRTMVDLAPVPGPEDDVTPIVQIPSERVRMVMADLTPVEEPERPAPPPVEEPGRPAPKPVEKIEKIEKIASPPPMPVETAAPPPRVAEAPAPPPTPARVAAAAPEPRPVESVPDEIEEAMDASIAALVAEARAAEAESVEKGIDVWRKVAQRSRTLRTPRRALARIYEQLERWTALVEVLKEEVDLVGDTGQKIALLSRMVEVHRDRLGLDVMVVQGLSQILQLDPARVDVLDGLCAQYEKMKRWTDLIGTLRKKAEVLPDVADQVAVWVQIAQLFEERFNNKAEAIKAYEQVVELDPTHPGALTALKAMYEQRRDWEKMIAIYQREIEMLQDPEERKVRTVELAELASSKLRRPQTSLEMWNKVLEVDPDNLKALTELETLYERGKEWGELARVCQRQADLQSDAARKVAVLQKLGILYSEKLQRDDLAIQAWRDLLIYEPDNRRAQDTLKKLYLTQRDYNALEEFYATQDKWDEYIRVLERQVEQEDAATQLELYFKIADLWQTKLDKADRAMRAYEKILTLDEQNLRAAEALIPLYEGGRDVRRYAAVLQIQLDHTDDDLQRLERLQKLSVLTEEKLREKEPAFQYYLQALAIDPRAEWPRLAAERLAGEVGRFQELVDAYEQARATLADPIDQLPLMLTVARLYEQELSSVDEALKANQAVLEIEAQNPQAIEALVRLYTRTERWGELLDVYQRKVELVQDPTEQREIHLHMAALYEEELADFTQAVASYRTVLDLVGEDAQALRALDRIYLAQEQWHDLAEILLRELSLVGADDPDAQVALKFRLGTLREERLEDIAGAIDCYRDILDLSPRHEGARTALERRLRDESFQLDAARVLEPIYAKLGDFKRLVETSEIKLAREDDPATRMELLLFIGNLWVEKLGDGAKAFDAYSRCFREQPDNETARAELERLADIQESWKELAALYEDATLSAMEAPLQLELLMRLATITDEKLEQRDKAVGVYRKAQALEPDNAVVLEALERLYTRGEQWQDLLDIYRMRAELTQDPEEREGFYFRMATLWEEMQHNLDEAVNMYREILTQDEHNLRALRALDRIYQQQQNWAELADNLGRQLALSTDPAQTIPLLLRLAALREHELSETEAAVETYRQVLELDERNNAAVEALERLIVGAEHQLTVAQILEPIYRKRNDWQKLVQVYEIMVSHSYDPAGKIELLHRIGELYELAGEDPGGAFLVYGRALREDPANETTQTHLEKLARELGSFEELVSLYSEIVADVMDEMLAVSLHMKMARILERNVEDLDRAAAAFLRILSLDAQNMEAITALEQIYLRAEAHDKLVQVLLKRAEVVLDAEERKALLFRAAQIHEDLLEDPEQAIRVYQLVFEIDDADPTAMESLERLYMRLARWDALKDLYVRKVELCDTVEEKKAIYYRIGGIFETQLRDLERAIETFTAVTDLDPNDLVAIAALDRLYAQGERWYDLLQILERQVELTGGTSAEAVGFRHRIGSLWQHQLGDLARAVETYREVLGIDPSYGPTLEALDALVRGDEEAVMAAQVLEPIYEQAMEFERLIDLYEVMVRHSDDPLRKQELLHRIAELYETKLDDSAHAFQALARALREDNTDEQALLHLERLAEQVAAWETLAQLLEEELEKVLDADQKVQMCLRVARIYEEELGQAPSAIAKFRQALEVDSTNLQAVLALDRLYSASEMWPELAEILRKEVQLAKSDTDIIGLQFRLGEIQKEQLGDLKAAVECYRDILAVLPDHQPSVTSLELLLADGHLQAEIAEILEPLYRMSEQWDKLVTIMEVQLQRAQDPYERVQTVQRIAEICEQKLGDHDRAFQWWGQAFLQDPYNEVASEELERLSRIVDGWESLAQVYGQAIERLEPDERKRVLMMQARVFEEELHDPERAEGAFGAVLRLDESDAGALAALDRVYTQTSQFAQLAGILRRRIAQTDSTDELVELQLRLGRTYETELADPAAAVEWYTNVLDQDSRNPRALEALEKLYFNGQRWAELYDIYERMIDIAPGDAGVADCYARMAKIASDALRDPERAKDLWNRVLDLRGEDPVALWAVADLYEAAQEWKDLVEVLQRQVRISAGPEAQIRLQKRLGRIYAERLGRDRNALEAWFRVLELDPSDQQALYAIATIYRRTQAWDELGQTLRRLIDLGTASDMSEDELARLYTQLGEIEGEILLRPDEAISAWRKVLAIHGGDQRALGALEQLLTQEARWEEVIQVLMHRAGLLQKPKDKIEVLLQAAATWQEKLENNENASRVYEQVLELEPAHEQAFQQLSHLYREAWHWDKLIELFLARTDLVERSSQRVELLQEVAQIYEEKLDSAEQAFVVMQAAFKEDYTNDRTAENFERLASATNKWNELLLEYNQVVQNLQDARIKADLLVKMGKWYGTELGHMEYATASLDQALKLNPECVAAMRVLESFHRKAGRWSELVSVMKRHADLEEDKPKRVELLLALAELYENQLSDQAMAIPSYRRALEVDATCKDALDALERLYRSIEQWEALIEILERKAGIAEDMEQVIALRRRIGELYSDQLANPQKAIAAYKEIQNLDPQNRDALRALELLYERTEDVDSFLDVMEQQLDVAASNDERIALYQRMAGVYEEQQAKLDRAAECLEKVLEIAPDHEPTYRALERLYKQSSRYTELTDIYSRHIMAIKDPQERADLYMAMGQVYEASLQDADRAIEAYTNVLSFDGNNTQALDALARLYEQIEAWERAADVMHQLTQLVDDPAYQVNILFRLGRITEEQMRDPARAEEYYQRTLSYDPGHVGAMVRLIELYKVRGDWAKAASMMVRAEERTTNPLEKARLLFEAGVAYLKQLDDEEHGTELLARCLQVDPDHQQAGEPLAAIYFRQNRYQEVEPILDMLIRKADRRDNALLQDLYFKLARTTDQLQKNDKALKYYRAAYDIDSTHLPTLHYMADLLFRLEDWDRAFKIYQTILVHHRDSQKPQEIVEIYYRLGTIKLKLGERKKALNMYEKALEIDAGHLPTLEAVIDLQSKQNDWDAVITAKRAMLPAADEARRFAILEECGDIYREKLGSAPKAVLAYTEALEHNPQSHQVLFKLIELYHETKQWKEAVDALSRMAELETDKERRSKYLYTAAVIYRDEIKALDESVDYFNKSLDDNPGLLKSFEAIDRLCTQRKDWKALERNYRKMLKRLPQEGQNELKVMLWHNLGEIYRTRLADFKSSATAFEVAASLDQDNLQRHEILAELYMLIGPEYAQKAVTEHHELIKHTPFRFESYKALYRIYMDTRQYDKSWCLASALAFLKKADPDEQQFYEQYKQRGFVRAKQRLTDEHWHRHIFHPDEDRFISAIFGIIAPVIGAMTARPHKAYRLKRKERRDLATDQLLFSKIFAYVHSVLGVMPTELYLRPEQPTGVVMAHTTEIPSFVVGADMLQNRPEKELAFAIAKQLSFMRPEHFLRNVLGAPSQMKTVFFAALKMVEPNFPVPPADMPAVEQTLRHAVGKFHPAQLEALTTLVRKYASSRGDVNLNRWWTATEMTANRVGFILCNDLEVASKMVSTEPASVGGMSPKDKVKDLVLYSISEGYFSVRKGLGLAIGQ